jgi:acyl-CoA reductase-like NAD-dependent aldehyde dehydrogenase
MSKRFMSNSISNLEVPKLSYDPVSNKLCHSLRLHKLKGVEDYQETENTLSLSAPAPASVDAGAAPTVFPPLNLAVLAAAALAASSSVLADPTSADAATAAVDANNALSAALQ